MYYSYIAMRISKNFHGESYIGIGEALRNGNDAIKC